MNLSGRDTSIYNSALKKKKKRERPQPFCLLALDTFKSCRVNCSICYGHFLKQLPVVFCISQGVDFISVRQSVHACAQPRNSEPPPRSSDETVLLKKCSWEPSH